MDRCPCAGRCRAIVAGAGPQPAPPARVAQDLDAVMAFAPDPDPLATSGVARIDDDPSVRTAFARQVPNPRRIAMWSGAVLVLLALLLIGMHEFRQERQAGRVLDVLGISRGTGAGDSAAVSASAVGPAAPVTPPIAADAGAAKPMPTEPTAADSPARRHRACVRLPRQPRTTRQLTGRTRLPSLRRLQSAQPRSASTPPPNARGAATCLARPSQPARGLRCAYAVLAVPLHANAVQPAPVGIACPM